MNLRQALATKDQMTKQALYDIFREDENVIERIDQAFKNAVESWFGHMLSIFGVEETSSFVKLLSSESDISSLIEPSAPNSEEIYTNLASNL